MHKYKKIDCLIYFKWELWKINQRKDDTEHTKKTYLHTMSWLNGRVTNDTANRKKRQIIAAVLGAAVVGTLFGYFEN